MFRVEGSWLRSPARLALAKGDGQLTTRNLSPAAQRLSFDLRFHPNPGRAAFVGYEITLRLREARVNRRNICATDVSGMDRESRPGTKSPDTSGTSEAKFRLANGA